jgi:hypothetical protein
MLSISTNNINIQSTNDYSNIESQNSPSSLSTRHTVEDNESDKQLITTIKFIATLLVIAFIAPFTICDLYFGFTDDSCAIEKPGKLAVDLRTYLVVCGLLGAAAIVVFVICVCCFDILEDFLVQQPTQQQQQEPNFIIHLVFGVLTNVLRLFNVAWTIMGAIIFWKLIDNNNCNSGIYNYVFAQLIIRLIFTSSTLLKKEKKTN